MTKEEWIQKCAARFIERGSCDDGHAKELAEACWEEDSDVDPVEAADNEMDCWGADE